MQISPSEIIRKLTQSVVSHNGTYRDLAHKFALEFNWRPSDYFPANFNDVANAHLLVEHGLKNTAVLTFLRSPNNFRELGLEQTYRLLDISYNNLTDWHIIIGANEATTVYNRVKESRSRVVHQVDFLQGGQVFDELRSERFDQIIGKKPNPNYPPLDEILIRNISDWKRKLSVEIEQVSNQDLSALFNAIIFARAVEDSSRTSKLRSGSNGLQKRYLLNLWDNLRKEKSKIKPTIENAIFKAVEQLLGNEEIPDYLVAKERLKTFQNLDDSVIWSLISSFYGSESIPYEYDFSIMSKHALSRIYEQYVSVLKVVEPPETKQLSFGFHKNTLFREEKNKSYGSIYTPQYIARFFAKFLRKFLSISNFSTMKVAEPACGSGIFLRTLLEVRFEQVVNGLPFEIKPELVRQSFKDILGIDYDANATQATLLSLALLHLALKDSFPEQLSSLESFPKALNIVNAETVEYFQNNTQELTESQDVVIANPPFVSVDNQPEAIRERIHLLMQKYAKGKIGTELAFLRLGLEMLKPNGIGLFVLPHSFLFLEGASKMRQELAKNTSILCLADLSAINVFKDVGIYTLLLAFQKKPLLVEGQKKVEEPEAVLVKCQDFVERALQAVLDDHEVERPAYSVYRVNQKFFQSKHWAVVSQSELNLENKYKQFSKIGDYLEISLGFVTGADPIFIRSVNDIPKKEREIYIPYLPDREMMAYAVPENTGKVVFYPYFNNKLLTEDELQSRYPQTWEYLSENEEKLSKRSLRNKLLWWKPVSPTTPEKLARPKIVTPNLTISPRFSLDLESRYSVSRSPFFYLKEKIGREYVGNEKDVLKFFVAVLNSSACYWYISNHSHKFGRGYAKLEPKTLKHTPVPPPDTSFIKVRQIIDLVDERLIADGRKAINIEIELDNLVADLYELSKEERIILGMEV